MSLFGQLMIFGACLDVHVESRRQIRNVSQFTTTTTKLTFLYQSTRSIDVTVVVVLSQLFVTQAKIYLLKTLWRVISTWRVRERRDNSERILGAKIIFIFFGQKKNETKSKSTKMFKAIIDK